MKFNPSMLRKWQECQLQAYLSTQIEMPWEQNAAASAGTCVHEAIELLNTTNDYTQAVERFKYTWANPEVLDATPVSWPARTNYDTYLKMGLKAVESYYEKSRLEERVVIATEHRFQIPYGDHTLSGIVDELTMTYDKDGKPVLEIIDLKTNSRKPTKNELRMNIQMTSYVYASYQPEFWLGWEPEIEKYKPMKDGQDWLEIFQTPGIERKAYWWHLRTGQKLYAGDRTEADFLRLYRLLMSIDDATKAGVFVPTIDYDNCFFCPFKEQCTAVGPVEYELLENQRRVEQTLDQHRKTYDNKWE